MAEPTRASKDSEDVKVEKAVRAPQGSLADYVSHLGAEHKMLVALKTQLYGGSWEPMLDDLRNRLAGQPYIFKLVNRIQEDIERIEEMKRFEAEHGVDLADLVEMP
jgi:hypothetical protein